MKVVSGLFGIGLAVALMLTWLAGCAAGPRQPQPSAVPQPSTTPQPADDRAAIRQLILLEAQGVVRQDLAGLTALWATDAVVCDAQHTADDAADDRCWRGRAAIRERYALLVFPAGPAVNSPTDIEVAIAGEAATAVSTTRIGREVSPGGDRWRFVRRDGRWWIAGLTYNLEPR